MNRVVQILSASAEAFLRRNLGCRYVPTILLAFGICCVYAALTTHQTVLMDIFLFAFLIRVAYHGISNLLRRQHDGQEHHSYSTGESLSLWKRFRFSQATVRRGLEPALCLMIGGIISPWDMMLAAWIVGAGFSLFIKEQLHSFHLRRRVLDMVDSRIESQQLNSTVTQYLTPRREEGKISNRAHLPADRPRRTPNL